LLNQQHCTYKVTKKVTEGIYTCEQFELVRRAFLLQTLEEIHPHFPMKMQNSTIMAQTLTPFYLNAATNKHYTLYSEDHRVFENLLRIEPDTKWHYQDQK